MEENKSHPSYTFSKAEKLCSQKAIDALFGEGSSFVAYPLRVVYSFTSVEDAEMQYPQILVSVSKRKFKRANKRNRVKRLIREVYRLNKSVYIDVCKEKKMSMNLAFIYLKDELPNFQEIEKSIKKTITVIKEKEIKE